MRKPSNSALIFMVSTLVLDHVRQKSDGQGSARSVFRELDWDHSGGAMHVDSP